MVEKFEGCILGLAIGDALGMPAEEMSRDKIKEIFGEIREFIPSPYGDLKAGQWTDDTEQMILLAESILETVYFNPSNFAEKLKNWYLGGGRRVGPTTRIAVINLLRGATWQDSGIISDTCGSAMRVAPIGLVYHFNLNLVENYAEISSSITHKGSTAIGGAIAVAIAIACKVLDFSDEEMLEEVVKRVEKQDQLLADKIRFAYEIRDRELDYAVEKLGNSISALDAVPMSFYCVFSSKDFERAVIKSANCGGDTDSISAITGAIKGAEGVDNIPNRFIEGLEDSDFLIELANRLYELHERIVKII
ncbi:MAG: ADP-ribosylglycohydrolase family protein [Archaeoglobaceae archaeon]|nr:ADP-ribosylglycohydrolase family protein [Archaeoglobaceae archaeon]MDW8118125.1 ADP-ribosylglycohydrolase family protein [Archaeoglobaceae archaeon]